VNYYFKALYVPPEWGCNHVVPVGESERLQVERRPLRCKKRSLTFLASSSSSRFFWRSSSDNFSSGRGSFTRSITCPSSSQTQMSTHNLSTAVKHTTPANHLKGEAKKWKRFSYFAHFLLSQPYLMY